MRTGIKLTHKFVDAIPDQLEDGTVYVSIEYRTAVHKCCCGCQSEVVTPIGVTDWKLTFDGEGISLHPSIGNWGFKCQSHYWIRNNKVEWAGAWSKQQIESGRAHDQKMKEVYFHAKGAETDNPNMNRLQPKPGIVSRFLKWFAEL